VNWRLYMIIEATGQCVPVGQWRNFITSA